MSSIICRECKKTFPLADFINEKNREIFIRCLTCRVLFEPSENQYSNTVEETCVCGSTYKLISRRLHLRSKKHRDFYKWQRMEAEVRKARQKEGVVFSKHKYRGWIKKPFFFFYWIKWDVTTWDVFWILNDLVHNTDKNYPRIWIHKYDVPCCHIFVN
jgi:hypothetical protein